MYQFGFCSRRSKSTEGSESSSLGFESVMPRSRSVFYKQAREALCVLHLTAEMCMKPSIALKPTGLRIACFITIAVNMATYFFGQPSGYRDYSVETDALGTVPSGR
jgi:hypothetical protein